jgi:hypothetical protein
MSYNFSTNNNKPKMMKEKEFFLRKKNSLNISEPTFSLISNFFGFPLAKE